jgi:cation transport ATPase
MNKQEAVETASVNLTTKKLVVTFDEDNINIERMQELIAKAGFSAKEHIPEKHVVIPIEGMT